MGQRVFGILSVWIASEHGGHGYVDTVNSERYFVHRNYIRSGDPRPVPLLSFLYCLLPMVANIEKAAQDRQREDAANRSLSLEQLRQKANAVRGTISPEVIRVFQG
jgi:hypothetical protein